MSTGSGWIVPAGCGRAASVSTEQPDRLLAHRSGGHQQGQVDDIGIAPRPGGVVADVGQLQPGGLLDGNQPDLTGGADRVLFGNVGAGR